MVFVSAVEVETSALNALDTVPQLKAKIEQSMDQVEAFCAREGLSTARFVVYGTDPIESLEGLIRMLARGSRTACASQTP